MRIYYYYPLQFHYHSGQTIQVIQDYKSLSEYGHEVFLYGTYDDKAALAEIEGDIGKAPIHLLKSATNSKWNRDWLRLRFLAQIALDRSPKVVISRNYNKTREITLLKPFLGPTWILMERHEDAFPYLLKKQHQADRDRGRFRTLFDKVDALILTNYSQTEIFNREFQMIPQSIVLPNGVDIDQFEKAEGPQDSAQETFVLTYIGQFTPWKNVELLFRALTYLDRRFTLRIAGGKGDAASRQWVDALVDSYGLQGRVDYRGFISRRSLVDDVLTGSSALLLPLGDNLESRYLTSPMKLFEYMATKIPVVAVDYPSVRLITGEDTVYLGPNDPAAFAKTIQEAVLDPDRKSRILRMNEKAKHYSYKERAMRFDAYLRGLVEGPSGVR